jgi:uncharacterized protein with von Willebrand factor type A (vWA) domain
MAALLDNLLVFGRLLRALCLEVHVGRLLDIAEALPHVNLAAREDVHHTCRALLVHRHEDLEVFDRAFDAFWRLHRDGLPAARRQPDEPQPDDAMTRAAALAMSSAAVGDTAAGAAAGALQTWSAAETLAHKDFAEFSVEEMALARAVMDRLEWTPGERRTRRWARGQGPRVDLRRALARSVHTGGDVFELPRRRRRTHPRPLVMLCDVSGSMDRYSRMLLHFAHAIERRHRRVEAFVFATRLTRVTGALRARGLDRAVSDASRAVPDWSGGTRIGDALRQLHQRWRRALGGGPVVLIISDGWDRGDPALLADQVRRLQRSCHRLIWLNPLIGTLDYAPLTRGLQAALPYVDHFLPARTLSNLAELTVHLNALKQRG